MVIGEGLGGGVLVTLIILAVCALGTLVDATALLVIIGPVVASLARPLHMDPVQLGIVTVAAITIGGITLPVGGVMYTAIAITGASIVQFARAIWPYILALLVVLVLITTMPFLTLGLPGWLM